MQLSSIFSNGMVIQRNKPIIIKGYAYGNLVTVTFAGKTYQTQILKESYFELELPPMEAGGPYEMVLYDGDRTVISDIMIGEVYVLGGQSNMELPIIRTMDVSADDVANVKEPNIRMFEVAKEYNFQGPAKVLESGSWIKVDEKSVLNFSAVGYFLAVNLYEVYKVPIGLIQTAVGGTPIEAWLSEESLMEMGLCKEQLQRNKDIEWVNNTIESDNKRIAKWHETMRKKDPGINEGWHKKGQMQTFTKHCIVPGMWENTSMEGYKGSVWFAKEFEVPNAWRDNEVLLRLGAIIDGDETYVNGVLVGHTDYRYPPRKYLLPPGLLCEGKNKITIRMFSDAQPGGFMPGKKYGLEYQDEFISLEGEWKYEIGAPMKRLEPQTFFQYEPAGVYNKMIAPLRDLGIRAILFYQGESNTKDPVGYADKMEKMIHVWREVFRKEETPFIFVALPLFTDGKEGEPDENWQELRLEQKKALRVSNTAMVDAYDLGEYNDLHPQNKKELGKRLALAVRTLIFGEEV